MHYHHCLLLISIILILSVGIKSQDSKGPGKSSCNFFGGRTDADCGLSDVLITDIPEKCTSIIYSAVYMDLKYNATDTYEKSDFKLLDDMLKSGKPVFIYYVHETLEEWGTALASSSSNKGNNSYDEMEALKGFFIKHPKITGIILEGLQLSEDSKEIPGLQENLKKYLKLMKQTFPELVVGLDLRGNLLIDQYTYPKLKWLNINDINSVIDFYEISLEFFNPCYAELRNTGIVPMSGNANYTLDKLKAALQKGCFPNEKLYFKFELYPLSIDEPLTGCQVINEKMCTEPQMACDWCSDTTSSYNDKGKFSADNGVGFMVRYIDYDDAHNCCQCETPYPAFNAILDGFNGVTTKPCNLLNRN